MKSFSELTKLEMAKLNYSQAALREAALRFASDASFEVRESSRAELYFAARHFSETVREIGMDHLWKQPECPQPSIHRSFP